MALESLYWPPFVLFSHFALTENMKRNRRTDTGTDGRTKWRILIEVVVHVGPTDRHSRELPTYITIFTAWAWKRHIRKIKDRQIWVMICHWTIFARMKMTMTEGHPIMHLWGHHDLATLINWCINTKLFLLKINVIYYFLKFYSTRFSHIYLWS